MIDEQCRGAGGDGVRREVVTVVVLATHAREDRAGAHLARVNRDVGDDHVGALEDAGRAATEIREDL